MLRISENLVGDNSLSIVFDLNFFLRLFYFYTKRDIQTLESVTGVIMRVCQLRQSLNNHEFLLLNKTFPKKKKKKNTNTRTKGKSELDIGHTETNLVI